MRIIKKSFVILTTIMMLLASYMLPLEHKASAAEPITVAEAIANNTGTATVKGYIVGYTKGTNNYQFAAPFASNQNTNIAIADSADERDPAKILPVQLQLNEFRTKINLYNNPNNLGKEIIVTGSLEVYFTVPGLKSPTAMNFVGEEPPPTGDFEGIEGLIIHKIQGEGHNSPYKDQNVKGVDGVVTHVGDTSNFYMQGIDPDDNSNTSEGILVYKPTHNIRIGDLVSVNGLVKEWVLEGYSDKLQTDLAMTEINAQNGSVTKMSSGQALPEAIVIGSDVIPPTQVVDNDQLGEFDPQEDGIDFYESLEGMRVSIKNPMAVAPQKYGEIPVITGKVDGKVYTTTGGIALSKDNANPERLHLLFDDNDFVAKTGDAFNGTFTGVVSYSFQNFKIVTDKESLPPLVESVYAREVTEIGGNGDKLTVATYNIENYTAANTEKTNNGNRQSRKQLRTRGPK